MATTSPIESRTDTAGTAVLDAGTFESAADRVLYKLRAALARVIADVPGGVAKPGELQGALGIDKKLSYKVFKVVSAPGSLAAGPHVPGLSALRTFLKAARNAGVSESTVVAADEAVADFDHLVARHATDRTAFDTMVSSFVDSEEAQQIAFQHRRAAFRAQRHIFGVHSKVQLKCVIIQPTSDDPQKLDGAQITGYIALRRLRLDCPLVITRTGVTDDRGNMKPTGREPEPLGEPADQMCGLSLLREFCSQPPPQIKAVRTPNDGVRVELITNGLGSQAAVTCIEGHIWRRFGNRYAEAGSMHGRNWARVLIPCEVLLVDLLVHEDTFPGGITPSGRAYAEHLGEPNHGEPVDSPPLEPFASVVHLGKGASALFTPDMPRYPELGEYVFDRLGWDGDRFDVYRCRVEYPVVPSLVANMFDLPVADA